jgi:hypothetical protein
MSDIDNSTLARHLACMYRTHGQHYEWLYLLMLMATAMMTAILCWVNAGQLGATIEAYQLRNW